MMGRHWVADISWLWMVVYDGLGGTLFNVAWVWIAYRPSNRSRAGRGPTC